MTQTTQATAPQNSEQSNNLNRWEEMAKHREIGDETRKMLIAHGKITDATSIVGEVLNTEYGIDSDKMLQPFYDAINDSQRTLLELLGILMDNNLNDTQTTCL